MNRIVRIAMAASLLGGMAMGDNVALTAAKRAKKDEFYTQRVDIENELRHYKAHFRDKIVVTNPPFSLFREYVAQLVKYDKKFLIIGNVNAITYKEIFPLFMQNRVWLGASIHSGDRKFGVPDGYPLNAAGCGIDENGQRFIRVKGVRWFTNLDYPQRHEKLPLYKQYSPKEFPKYDNYDAINVNKTADIPYNYDGVMGVPITFVDKYNPEQFEILGITNHGDMAGIPFRNGNCFAEVNGQRKFVRIFIRRRVK